MVVTHIVALGGGQASCLRPYPGMFWKTCCNNVAVEETTDKVMMPLAGHVQQEGVAATRADISQLCQLSLIHSWWFYKLIFFQFPQTFMS